MSGCKIPDNYFLRKVKYCNLEVPDIPMDYYISALPEEGEYKITALPKQLPTLRKFNTSTGYDTGSKMGATRRRNIMYTHPGLLEKSGTKYLGHEYAKYSDPVEEEGVQVKKRTRRVKKRTQRVNKPIAVTTGKAKRGSRRPWRPGGGRGRSKSQKKSKKYRK